jgi:hypothetical protein
MSTDPAPNTLVIYVPCVTCEQVIGYECGPGDQGIWYRRTLTYCDHPLTWTLAEHHEMSVRREAAYAQALAKKYQNERQQQTFTIPPTPLPT